MSPMSMNSFHRRSHRSGAEKQATTPLRPRGGIRVDQLLLQQGLAASRTAARALIEAGRIRYEGAPVQKPSALLPESAKLDVLPDETDRFVARGGIKLAGALTHCGLAVDDLICLDVGQSTGGFSDCLLQVGAACVIGVEVGHGQLHPHLRDLPRCITLEGINARYLSRETLGSHFPSAGFGLIVCDASFISLTLLMPQWPALLADDGNILALVKPQFEVGPGKLGKGGIVRNAAFFDDVRDNLFKVAETCRLQVLDWFDSPITGRDGNREFFIWMRHAKH